MEDLSFLTPALKTQICKQRQAELKKHIRLKEKKLFCQIWWKNTVTVTVSHFSATYHIPMCGWVYIFAWFQLQKPFSAITMENHVWEILCVWMKLTIHLFYAIYPRARHGNSRLNRVALPCPPASPSVISRCNPRYNIPPVLFNMPGISPHGGDTEAS